MSQFVITGPTKLSGTFNVMGSKNAVLPILAASLLTSDKIALTNVPDITDVAISVQILEHLGATVTREGHKLIIDSASATSKPIPDELSSKIRASILFLGPMLARFGEVSLPLPGGDIIGARPLDVHINGMRQMGAEIGIVDGIIKAAGKLKPADITLEALSVTGTENLLMAAVLTSGRTLLRLAAVEPHVSSLANFLISMGAKIHGIGSHWLVIEGVGKLAGTNYEIIPDYLEAGTIAIAAVATRSSLQINGFWKSHNEALLQILTKMGANIKTEKDYLLVAPNSQFRSINIKTEIFPGFPSDLQAPIALLLTQAQGTSEIFETIFEGRLSYLRELERMGANAFIKDAHTGIITGPTPLHGKEVVSIDVRAGATMVVAALLAEGVTTVEHIEHIDRGYEKLDERLNAIGAHIERVN